MSAGLCSASHRPTGRGSLDDLLSGYAKSRDAFAGLPEPDPEAGRLVRHIRVVHHVYEEPSEKD